MTNAKISALTAATTPLAGTEVLPIVQSSATVNVAVSDLTAGRAVSVASLTATGTITPSVGAIATPSIRHPSNAATGVWFPTVNQVAMSANGTQSITATPSGATINGTVGLAMGLTGNATTTSINWGTNGTGLFGSATAVNFSVSTVSQIGINSSGITIATGNVSISTSGKGITTGSAIPLGFGTNTGTAAMTLNTTGTLSVFQAPTASAPTYVKGAMYFDTTLNKLRIGGATAWETVTSV